VWVLFLGARSWRRQGDWYDQRTFILSTIAAGGDSARMRVNLGNVFLAAGDPEHALVEYRAALAREPHLAFAQLGIANAELHLTHYDAARAALDACGENPGLDAEIAQLRTALDFAQYRKDPVPGYHVAADHAPLNWPLRKRAITALAQTGRMEEAAHELIAFIEEQDFRADPWKLLSDFLIHAGKKDEAAVALARARALDCRLTSK
jgi:thioredoxin-like negative regulator of GroEL